jgi:hypothetical protein
VQRIEIEPGAETATVELYADPRSVLASTRVLGGDDLRTLGRVARGGLGGRFGCRFANAVIDVCPALGALPLLSLLATLIVCRILRRVRLMAGADSRSCILRREPGFGNDRGEGFCVNRLTGWW